MTLRAATSGYKVSIGRAKGEEHSGFLVLLAGQDEKGRGIAREG
jgi:hypothetical protein